MKKTFSVVRGMRHFVSLLLLLFVSVFAMAQSDEQTRRLNYWGDADGMIAEQTRLTFDLVNQILNENPPTLKDSPIRKLAFFSIDAITHDPRNDGSLLLPQFMSNRIQHILAEMQKPVTDGMMIYKLYNCGFVVKTKSVTIAFDLFRGGKRDGVPFISNELMQKVVDNCDIMFVTHQHSDHSDPVVRDMFIRAGKEIIVAPGLWEEVSPLIKPMRSEQMMETQIRLANGQVLQTKIFPGHQDDMLNNIYVVTTPEGISVTHAGDQAKDEDMVWIRTIKDHAKTDVLLINAWSGKLEEMAEGYAPKLMIPMHENEMNHTIDHRESNWLTYVRAEKVRQDVLYMTWGEAYHYRP